MIVRVAEPGVASFQLRKGEEGISAFDPDSVAPPLVDTEILSAFRAGSILVTRSKAEIEAKGLRFILVEREFCNAFLIVTPARIHRALAGIVKLSLASTGGASRQNKWPHQMAGLFLLLIDCGWFE